MKKVITTFQCSKTAEGQRISYAYSEIEDDGTLKSTNNRDNLIALDDKLQSCIDYINDFLTDRLTK